MAGTKILTRIATWLGIDSSGVDKGMIKAEKAVSRGQKRIGKHTKAMQADFMGVSRAVRGMAGVIGGALTVGGIARFTHATAQALDTVGKLSSRLGVSTEFLSEMGFAAERSGVQAQVFNVGIQRAIRRLEQFRDTGKGEAAEALRILGGGLEEAVRRGESFENLLPRLANAFRDLDTDAKRVLASMKLFDTEGVALSVLLKEGADGIAKLRQAARDAGATMSKEATDAAAKYNDALLDLKTTLLSIGIEAAPLLEGVAEVFGEIRTLVRDIVDDTTAWKNLFGGKGFVSDRVLKEAQRQSEAFGEVYRAIRAGAGGKLPFSDAAPPAHLRQNPPIFPSMRGEATGHGGISGPPEAGRMSIAEPIREGTQALQQFLTATAVGLSDKGIAGTALSDFGFKLQELAENKLPTAFATVMEGFKVTAEDFYFTLGNAAVSFSQAVGDAVAAALVEQENFAEALKGLLKGILKQIISALVQLAVQFVIFNGILGGLLKVTAVREIGTQAAISSAAVTAAAFKTFGLAGFALAPGLAKLAAIMTGTNAAAGGAIGAAAGGSLPFLDEGGTIAKSGVAVVHKGETVVPAGAFEGMTIVMDGRVVGQLVADQIAFAANGRGFRT